MPEWVYATCHGLEALKLRGFSCVLTRDSTPTLFGTPSSGENCTIPMKLDAIRGSWTGPEAAQFFAPDADSRKTTQIPTPSHEPVTLSPSTAYKN